MTAPEVPAAARDGEGRHPAEHLIHENIESILSLEDRARQAKPRLYRMVAVVAGYCGTVRFLVANAVCFAVWISLNLTAAAIDPYPFTFLLFLVSLEAIFLSILILISQNMAAEESERRHHLDLQINLLCEREMTALLRLSKEMADRLGVEPHAVREVASLASPTDPASVLYQIVDAEAAHRHPAQGAMQRVDAR